MQGRRKVFNHVRELYALQTSAFVAKLPMVTHKAV